METRGRKKKHIKVKDQKNIYGNPKLEADIRNYIWKKWQCEWFNLPRVGGIGGVTYFVLWLEDHPELHDYFNNSMMKKFWIISTQIWNKNMSMYSKVTKNDEKTANKQEAAIKKMLNTEVKELDES